MARIFIDGFESGEDDLWDTESNATIVSSVGLDMDGDYCLDLNLNPEYLEKNITATDEMYFAFLYRCTETFSKGIFTVYSNGNIMCHLKREDNVFTAVKGITELGDSTCNANLNTTYLIEIYLKIADSGGRFVVKINGVTEIDFTGDTKESTYAQFNKVRFGYNNYASYAYFDNFIMDNAAWIGNTNIQAVVPTGVGTTTGWTPSAGANYECVDEKPYSDADYVSTNVVDTTDTYAAGNMVGSIDNVKCVQVQARLLTDGAPTPLNAKIVVRSGATDYLSADNVVPAAAKSFSKLWENNPADSAAWAEADVNAMEIGVKSAA